MHTQPLVKLCTPKSRSGVVAGERLHQYALAVVYMTGRGEESSILCSQPFEFKRGFYRHFFTRDFEMRAEEIIKRAGHGCGGHGDVAAAAQFEAVSGVMTEIVAGEFGMLVGLADVHRHPFAIGEKFRPAMVAGNCARIAVGRNGEANGKSRGNFHRAAQCNKISVEIGAVSRVRVAGVQRIAASPALTGFIVTHVREHVFVERLAACKVVERAVRDFLCDGVKAEIQGHQSLGLQVLLRVADFRVRLLFFARDLVSNGNALAAVGRGGLEHEDFILVRRIARLMPRHR